MLVLAAAVVFCGLPAAAAASAAAAAATAPRDGEHGCLGAGPARPAGPGKPEHGGLPPKGLLKGALAVHYGNAHAPAQAGRQSRAVFSPTPIQSNASMNGSAACSGMLWLVVLNADPTTEVFRPPAPPPCPAQLARATVPLARATESRWNSGR